MAIPQTRLKWAIVCKETGNQVSKARYNPRKLNVECQTMNTYVGFEKYELRHIAPEQVVHCG